jgi:NADPH:quinone reductase-like Zn-dependent oxidoreductase
VLGNEFAGQVAAAGNGVTSFRVGDRVFGYTEGPFGAHAEYLVIAENGRVAVMPPNLDYEQAAPGTERAHYALSHIRRAKIGSSHRVMVYGATGAIGSAAVQLATPLLGGKKVVFAYPGLDQATVRHFARLMETGQFTPLIDRRYPLEQIVDAYRYAETGQKIGNLVITVAP